MVKFIILSVGITLMLVAGQLPNLLTELQLARLKLLKESQASKWPKALVLPEK